ncbi:hypothetical protein [Paraburkholderia phenoliruptrix]|uniref:hypothetical protein n=1 Tax=Paraburkholderia phenoliruptrix TaxID=252970 RepID=UPI002869945E|nr:hypothetical protein [Paraburkholderia phenoliruptrix]WMY08744.1 hypothetical protein P3F88_02905 [Paraburkholderia phenoliruptrix]
MTRQREKRGRQRKDGEELGNVGNERSTAPDKRSEDSARRFGKVLDATAKPWPLQRKLLRKA